ncbi:hypothetical protein Bca52824_067220 [Brassica carinata]|uniref:Uncharacterized protein n=1 Tax=Brassica carinata TaxID=52824 RepID=A0A8X7QQN1_BRACI|nr:hypothetical protein Bca52824_067220 [Brassica carinata]
MEGLRRPTKKKGLRKSTKVPLTVSNSTYEKVQANTHRNSSEPVSRVVMGDEGWRKIRLLCPSVSKIIDWVAWNDQKLDFKSIAAAFGLEPATVKLNGHFISRDNDLISSCVTWKSLLDFFSAKGLSTGKDGAGPLLVDGKLSRVGTKRAHFDPHEDITVNNLGLNRNKKLKDKCSVSTVEECLLSGCNKRKFLSEDRLSSKKLKLNMGDSLGSGGKTCSFTSDGLKRTREDDMIASTSRKKIR